MRLYFQPISTYNTSIINNIVTNTCFLLGTIQSTMYMATHSVLTKDMDKTIQLIKSASLNIYKVS